MVLSCRADLKSNQQVVDYSHDIYATDVAVGMSCQADCHCSSICVLILWWEPNNYVFDTFLDKVEGGEW